MVSKGSLWVLTIFNNIFMRANSLWRVVPKKTDRAPKGEAEPLKKTANFLQGLPLTPVRRRGCRRQKLRPGFAGKGTPFLQYPGRPAGDSGGFWICGRYLNWAFRDSGHFCPGKPDSGRCFSLKQEGFKLLRLPNLDNKKCEFFVDISLERQYNTEDEPECANIPALRLETRFVSAERQTVRRVIYD